MVRHWLTLGVVVGGAAAWWGDPHPWPEMVAMVALVAGVVVSILMMTTERRWPW